MTGKDWAVVTGGSGGIGAALAVALAKRGWNIALAARSLDGMEAVAARVRVLGVEARVVQCDLGQSDGPASLDAATADLPVTVLVNNAGYGLSDAVVDLPLDDQLGMIDLNVRALTELSWRFAKRIKMAKRGGIINVASTASFQPGPNMAVYYATKAYVLSLSEAMAAELKADGLTITALCPGPVASGFQARAAMEGVNLLKLVPMMTAEQTAEAGVQAFVDGKAVVIPGLLNFIMAKSVAITPRFVLMPLVRFLQGRGRH